MLTWPTYCGEGPMKIIKLLRSKKADNRKGGERAESVYLESAWLFCLKLPSTDNFPLDRASK